MSMFPFVTEGGWQTWGQWKQNAPGVRARIRTKDTQDPCPNKYKGMLLVTLNIQKDKYCIKPNVGMSSILGTNLTTVQ